MKIKDLLLWSLILSTNCFIINAQTKNCGTDVYWHKIKKRDKSAGLNLQKNNLRTSASIAVIPVVVHVLYNSSTQNISNDQIFSQIEALNKDFRKQNADVSKVPSVFSGIAADCEIQFCLAQRDPNGLPTTGITRTATTKTAFSNGLDDAKFDHKGGKTAWDTEQYLNLWVVPAITSSAGTVLGYSSFPGDDKLTDGVVIGYRYFGTLGTLPAGNTLGRTATHEIGHWLGLYHIFQDDCEGTNVSTCSTAGDLVCDTPPQKSVYDCPTTQNSCTEADDQIDMTMNYMGYTDDNCMYMFSTGQKNRMWYHLNTFRSSILSSKGCVAPVLADNNLSLIKQDPDQKDVCSNQYAPSVKIVNVGQNTITNVVLQYGTAVTQAEFSWQGTLATGASEVITLNPVALLPGSQEVYVKVASVNAQSDPDSSQNKITTQVNVLSTRELPFSENFEQESSFLQNWHIKNYGGALQWQRTDLAAVSGTHAIYMDNFDGEGNGEIDDLISPLLKLQKDAKLSFKYAYKLYTEENTTENFSDTLRVLVDVDCSGNLQEIFKGYGKNFTTGTPYFTTDEFIPTSSEWKDISLNLSAYQGKTARVIFRNTSDIENSLFIDDINITDVPLSVTEQSLSSQIKVFPTLSDGQVTVSCPESYQIQIYNSAGIFLEEKPNHINDVNVDVSKYPDHFLIFKVLTHQGSRSFKIFKK